MEMARFQVSSQTIPHPPGCGTNGDACAKSPGYFCGRYRHKSTGQCGSCCCGSAIACIPEALRVRCLLCQHCRKGNTRFFSFAGLPRSAIVCLLPRTGHTLSWNAPSLSPFQSELRTEHLCPPNYSAKCPESTSFQSNLRTKLLSRASSPAFPSIFPCGVSVNVFPLKLPGKYPLLSLSEHFHRYSLCFPQ